MAEKQDLRQERTQRHLREALCELLVIKPINKITIKELTDKAEISRCTFYLYYDSIYSMVKSIEDDMLSDYRDGLRRILSENVYTKELFSELIAFSFQHKYDNLPYSKFLYSGAGNPDFIDRYCKITVEELSLAFPGKIKENMIAAINFYLSGIVYAIHEWILKDEREIPEQMSAHIVELIANGKVYIDMFNSR